MVDDGDYVAIFHSIHRVMKAEKYLLGQGLDILLIPVPRSLSADCGMAIRFSQEALESVARVLCQVSLGNAEFWQKQDGEFYRIEMKEAGK